MREIKESFTDGNNIVGCSHGFAQSIDGVGERQQHNCRDRTFYSVGQRIHYLPEGNLLEQHADRHENDDEEEGFHRFGRVHGDVGAKGNGHDHQHRKDEIQEYPRLDTGVRLHVGELFSESGERHRPEAPCLPPSLFFLLFHRPEVLDDSGSDKTYQDSPAKMG